MLSRNPQPALQALELLIVWGPDAVPAMDTSADPPFGFLTGHAHWIAIDEVLANPAIFPELQGLRITPKMEFHALHSVPDLDFMHFKMNFPRVFCSEMMMVFKNTPRARWHPVLDAGWDAETREAFETLKESVLGRAGINGDDV